MEWVTKKLWILICGFFILFLFLVKKLFWLGKTDAISLEAGLHSSISSHLERQLPLSGHITLLIHNNFKPSYNCLEELLPSQALTSSNCAVHFALSLNTELYIYSVKCHPVIFRHLLQPSQVFILLYIVVAISSEFASYTNLMSTSSVSTSTSLKNICWGRAPQQNARDLP